MMEAKALKLWQKFSKQPQLWEGWDLAKTPIGFHNEKEAMLIGHPNPPDEFIKKEGEGVNYYMARPKPASFTANTSIILNGMPTATIIWQQREEEAMLGLISHEAFHAYQMRNDCPMGTISSAMKYPVNNAEVQALAITEADLLYRSQSGTTRLDTVAAALDARAARQNLLAAEIAAYEDEVELGEGLATYVEIKSAGPGSKLWNSKIQMLKKLNIDGWGADRLRFYYSGMAWALLCDKYAPGWQQVSWQPLASIVTEAIGHTPKLRRREFPDIDFEHLLLQQKQQAEARAQQMETALTQAFPGSGIRVKIHCNSTPIGAGWNPKTAITFPGEGRFHPTGLMYVYDTGTKLEVKKNCLEKEHTRQIVFERPDLTITLNGNSFTSGKGRGHLVISSADVNVNIRQARVQYDGKKLLAEEVI